MLDPHAAVAWHAWQRLKDQLPQGPVLLAATASPFKFPQAVLSALGAAPIPDGLVAMGQLAQKTGLSIPLSLAWLPGAPDIRHQVIDPADIPAAAFQEARIW